MNRLTLALAGILAAGAFSASPALIAGEPPAKPKEAKLTPPARTPALVERGMKAYGLYCLMCHGEKGDGKGPAGVALKPPPRNFAVDAFVQGQSTVEIFKTVTHGVPKTLMVGYSYLSEDDRWGLAYFVGDFVPKKAKK